MHPPLRMPGVRERPQVRLLFIAAALFAGLLATPSATQPKLDDLLARYDKGEFQAVVGAMRGLPVQPPVLAGTDQVRVDPLFLEWQTVATRWMAAADASQAARRRLVAASFAVELARARDHVNWFLRYPFVAWACGVLRAAPTKMPAERLWHLTAIAVLEENEDWPHVMGGLWTQMRAATYLRRTTRLFFDDADREEATTGHLAHAKAAFPDEVRWRLAEAHYEESQTFLEEAAGPLGIAGHQTSPGYRDVLIRAAAGQKINPPVGPISKVAATVSLDRLARIPDLVKRYEALNAVPDLRGDAALHLGFLNLRTEEWDAALAHLREVPQLTKEPALVSLSYHFTGWAYQELDQREAAITAYRQALVHSPHARSTSILLAAQLLDSGRQADAYTLMHEALVARPTPGTFAAEGDEQAELAPDLWPLYPRGDGLLVPTYLARLRGALK